MPTYSQKEILDKYENLPEDLKEALFSVNTAKSIQEVGKNNNLTVEKVGILAEETGLIMMGLIPTNQYIPRLTKRLNVKKEQAQKIAQEINTKIFTKIRENLKVIHGLKKAPPEKPKAPPEKPKPPEKPAISTLIKPQAIIAEPSKTDKKEATPNVPQEKPEAFQPKITPEVKTPEVKPEAFQPKITPEVKTEEKKVEPEKPEEKNIFTEKMKEGAFRSAPEVVEKKEQPFLNKMAKDKKAEKKADIKKYQGGADPYREPLE
jgi:hypothetical protein